MRSRGWKVRAGAVLAACFFLLAEPAAPARGGDIDEHVKALQNQSKVFAHIAEKARNAVVFIRVEKTVKVGGGYVPFNDPFDFFGDEFFRRFFRHRMPRPRPRNEFKQEGQGSGFIISPDGYILTNNHVVGDADRITVKLNDGREMKAKVIGTDPQTDVAVIKVDGKNLPTLSLGDSDKLEVGEWVIAIGNPFGLTQTVTVGVVSAKGRSSVGIVDYEDFIQTDAAINPGNSGGPLVNLRGEAVGINTAIFSRSGGYMGIGFAIPINMAKKVYRQLIKNGKISRGYLGVIIQNLTPDLAESFGLDRKDGVLISQVMEGTPAAKAGLKVGDVIVELDGRPVKKVGPFRNSIALSAPGSTHTLTVIRKGRRRKITVTLGNLEAAGTAAAVPPEETQKKLGVTVSDLTPEAAQRFGYGKEKGVVVTAVEPGSPAAAAGLAPGTLILEVNKKPVKSAAEFYKRISASVKKKENILLLVKENGYSRFVVIRLR